MTLDENQAYGAMFRFLETHWERGGKPSGDLAALLGSLNQNLWEDGTPADPAMWDDWIAAVRAVSR